MHLNNLKITPDIICLQETFLNFRYHSKLTGYTMPRKNRCSSASGGAEAILARNDIYFTELRAFDWD